MSEIFKARLFDELEPCYPDSDLNLGKTELEVHIANQSYAGVNILLSGLRMGFPVTFEIEGKNTAFKLFKMLPVPVEVNTGAKLRSEYLKNDYNENVIRRAPFMVYEALEPIYNIIMPTGENMGFCFKTIVEYVKEKALSEWKIKISHAGQTETLSFKVNEYPVTTPKTGLDTHKFVNWFSTEGISLYHNVPKWSERYFEIYRKYLRAAAFSRQNMFAVPLRDCFDVIDGHCVMNKERASRLVKIAKSVGMCYFEGQALASRASSLADNDDFYNSIDHSKINSSDEIAKLFEKKAFELFDYGEGAVVSLTGERLPGEVGERQLVEICSELYSFIKEEGLEEVWMQSVLDEPNDALCETYGVITKLVHENMPNIPIMEPVLPTEKVIGMMDIWCPSLDVYERNKAFFDKRVAEGDRIFVYTCLTPGGNYLNRLLDMERLRIVMLGWSAAKYEDVEGFLHWGGMFMSGQNPSVRSAFMFDEQILEFHPKRSMFLPAGDNYLFYPSFNEPLITIRSEAHRIGYEDLCLINMLKEKNREKADEIVSMLFRGYADYEKSVEKYREVKKLLLENL